MADRLPQIQEMLKEDPNDPELRYMLAMEYASQADDENAVRCFRELIAVRPDYPPAYHMGARALQRLDRIAEAKQMLQSGIPAAQKQGNMHAAGEMEELLEMLNS